MDIADIIDDESLEAWLNTVPKAQRRDWAVFIAARAATRVAPVMWAGFHRSKWLDLTDIRLWRVMPITRLASKMPSRDIAVAVAAAIATADADTVGATALAVDAASYAAYAASDAFAAAAYDAATAVAYAAGAAAAWDSVRTDTEYLTRGGDPFAHLPLWPDGSDDPFAALWDEVKTALGQTQQPETWAFWTDWFEAERAGRPMLGGSDAHWEMLAQIFEVNGSSDFQETDWEKGAGHINPLIHGIYERYKAQYPAKPKFSQQDLEKVKEIIQEAPYGHDIAVDPKRRQLIAVEVDTPELDHVITAIRDTLKDFTARCRNAKGAGNLRGAMKSAYEEAIRLLRRDLTRHKSCAFSLFESLRQARLEFDAIARTEGFSDDAAHIRLMDGLERRGQDICAAAPSVLETERERMRVQVALFTQEQKTMALRLCAGMHVNSHGVLHAASALAVQVILDPERSEIEQRNAWYFLIAAGPRGAKAMHEAELRAATPEETKSALEQLASAGDKLAKVDKGVDAIQEMSTEGADWVTEIITQAQSGNWFGLGG